MLTWASSTKHAQGSRTVGGVEAGWTTTDQEPSLEISSQPAERRGMYSDVMQELGDV